VRRTRWPKGGQLLVAYVGLLTLAAVLVTVVSRVRFGPTPISGRWVEFVLLVSVLCLCEMKPISVVRHGGVDDVVASTTFAFTILLSFGPIPAMGAQAFASILADARVRKAPIKILFNASQYMVSWGAAAFVFAAIDPRPTSFADRPLTAQWYLAVGAAAITYFVANNVLVALAMSLHSGHEVLRTIKSTISSEWSSDLVLLALTPIVVIVLKQNLTALPLLLLPILAVYRSATISAEKEHLALHDSLTDLPNRFNFSAIVAKAIEQSDRRSSRGAVLLIDLDRFKEVNDTLGHQAGDDLLCMIGPRIMEVLPASGTVARLGGDEFGVLLPELVDEPEAIMVARRIANALDAPFSLEGFNIEVEGSIGVTIYPNDGADGDVLLKRADIAMYIAKARRTVVERYDPELDHHTTRRLRLVGELRAAIAGGDIRLYYQPKLDLASGVVSEVEALVRWIHPRLGVVEPSEFVELAEHTGLIRPLTSHVLREAVAQAAQWRSDGAPLTVAVNLSARSLLDSAILQEVLSVLNDRRLPPSLLRLEITESSIMADPQRARKVLEQLHDMGIRLSIDDFGTGYSSLAYLQDLPVSEIKIDRSFVTNVLAGEGDQVIVRSTIELARNLGLTSVAEGVESAAALRWLVQAGCNQAQGYHIARPMTAAALDEWIAARPTRTTPPDRGGKVVTFAPASGAGC
jgi:diguanylate cyclase (GGDEF)-like protein